MCSVTSGRTEPCYNNIGGLINVYLFSYIGYRKYEISQDGTTLLKFPDTDIYKYELRADGNTFSSDLEEQPDGIAYNQTANFVLKGLKSDRVEINGLLNKRLGVIVETRLGHYQIMGLYNGVRVKSVKGSTGSNRDSFSGYNISLEAKELNQPFFIDDLQDVGFNIIAPLVPFYLLQENGFKLLQENASGILLDPPAPLQLVADYQFNNNLIDSVGGNNGTGTNITFNSGSFGNEAVFNGSSSFVTVADNDVFSFTDGVNDLPFRIELSVKLNSNTQQYLINKRIPVSFEWQIIQNGNFFIVTIGDAEATINISSQVPFNYIQGNYYNIVVTYDGSKTQNGLTISVDGVSNTPDPNNPSYFGMENTTAPVSIGKPGHRGGRFLNGAISQIKIYK